MEKEQKDRIADAAKEELKALYEFFRVGVFFLATIGSGSLAITFKEKLTYLEYIVAFVGYFIVILDFIWLMYILLRIRYFINELHKLKTS
jgi:tellurite resistance protein TehA-like permease